MANKETETCEKFKTMIGGQALIEGIMMRGPEKDAVVIRGKDGLTVEVSPRKLNPPGSWKTWPFIRGIFNFFDAQIVGVKALLRSADLAPDGHRRHCRGHGAAAFHRPVFPAAYGHQRIF